MYAALGCYGRAADDLAVYARLLPQAEDAAELSARAATQRPPAARLN
jgi:hypothetical protein